MILWEIWAMMKKLVLASGNKHKIKEFKEILSDYEILSMSEIGFKGDIDENGMTLEENALIKTKAIREFLDSIGLDYPVVADDSGLFCDALNGEPGINSARYAGHHGDDEANRQKLLRNLDGETNRRAYFGCIIVMQMSDGKYFVGDGKTYGKILDHYDGDTSFGYDCIFLSDDLGLSFGSASAEAKNSVSHRGRALQDLLKNITNNNYKEL